MSISVLHLFLACGALASPLAANVDSLIPNGHEVLPVAQRDASQGFTIQAPLTNGWLEHGGGGSYYLTADVGTPPQSLKLILDTGSSDFWVYGTKYRGNSGTDGVFFNETGSTTASSVDLPPFQIGYDGGAVYGSFITDDVGLSGTTLNGVTFALVDNGVDFGPDIAGLLGLSWDYLEANRVRPGVEYPTVVDLLYNKGYISSHTYSVYMDDINSNLGSILFGGYDAGKTTGWVAVLSTEPEAMTVPLQAVSITDASGSKTQVDFYETPIRALLDTGAWLASPLPEDTYIYLVEHIVGLGYNITDGDNPRVDCGLRNAQGSVDLTFTDTTGNETTNRYFSNTGTIAVPFSELAVPQLTSPSGDIQYCNFGFSKVGPGGEVIIGNACMRSMYVIFAVDFGMIALAQSRFNATESAIYPIRWPSSYVGGVI